MKLTAIIISLITAVLIGCSFLSKKNESQVRSKSVDNHSRFAKSHSPIQTTIDIIDQSSDGRIITLQGIVTTKADFDSLQVKWDLPSGLEIVSGLSISSARFVAGEPQKFELRIQLNTSERRQLFFRAESTDKEPGENLVGVTDLVLNDQVLSIGVSPTQTDSARKATRINF